MSINTTIYTGWYIKAIPSQYEGVESYIKCNGSADHRVFGQDKFCSTCGSPIVTVTEPTTYDKEMSDLCWFESDADWCTQMSEDDQTWLKDNCTPLPAGWVGNEDEHLEYVLLDCCSICIEPGNQEMDCSILKQPEQSIIDRVVQLMEYQSYTLHFGTLITYS